MNKILPRLFCLAVILGLIIIIFVPSTGSDMKINDEKVIAFSSTWELYQNGKLIEKECTLPIKAFAPKNDVIEIKRNLPDVFVSGMSIGFRSSQQLIKVKIDDKEIYSFGYDAKLKYGKSPGSAWNFVRIPANSEGKQLSIEFISPYSNYSGTISDVVYGSKSANVFHVLDFSLPLAVISLLIIFIGLILMLLHFFIRKQYNNSLLFYIGLFAVLSSTWSLCETKVLQIYCGNTFMLTTIAFICLMLFPIPFLLFAKEAYPRINKKIINFSIIAFLLNFIVVVSLQLTNTADFLETAFLTHIILAFCVILLLSNVLYNVLKHKDKSLKSFLFVFLILVIFSSFDFLSFYYMPTINDAAFFFRTGLLFFVITFAIIAGKTIFNSITENLKVKLLENLAFVDLLTNTNNRTCFERDMSTYRDDKNNCKNLSIIFADINNLKMINDTLGHKSGDNAIVIFSDCLKDIFTDKCKLYRIGGDEFVVICSNLQAHIIENKLDELVKIVKIKNINVAISFSVACGYATFDPSLDDNFDALLIRADDNMYQKKLQMKEKHS